MASTTPTATTPANCDTGSERAWRIAKPGLIGTVLGAGLGAAGGAIANGGKGAGTGAVVGGLAGAATGAGYGAYKTNNECGTIFGKKQATTTEPRKSVASAAGSGSPTIGTGSRPAASGSESPFRSAAAGDPSSPQSINVYAAR